ncbi:MAG: lamin tail domain-containing protein [Bacteroidota bacterium]
MKQGHYYYLWGLVCLLSIQLSLASPPDHPVPPHPQMAGDLILVGLVDGPLSGTPKFAELYVVNDIPDLSIYGLGSANNGGGTDGEEWTFPADAVTAGTTIYVANDTAAFTTFMGFSATYEDGGAACNFNGDDGFEVFQNGVVIDVYGDINQDGTGLSWEYTDAWVKRVDGTGPDDSTFVESNWSIGPINVFDGTTSNAGATTPYPTATYTPAGGTPTPTIEMVLKGVIYASATIKATEYEVLANIPDLSVYGIGCTNNGGGSDGQEWTFPAVSASAGDRIYVARDSAAFRDFFGFDADFLDPNGDAHNFNGDDGIEVFKDGSVIEIFGDTLADGTGLPWEYVNAWAHRNDGTGPDTATFVQANWTFSALNNYSSAVLTNDAAPEPYPVFMPMSSTPDLVLVGLIYASADVKSSEYYVLNDIADLSIYGVGGANNGGGTDGQEWTFPAASATAGDRIYVTRDSASFRDFFGFDADFLDPNGDAHNFNGDDAFELFQNGTVIDVFGDINVDGTGQPWEYVDTWVQRECATGPDSATFILSNWNIGTLGTFSGTTTNATAADPYPVNTYQPTPCNTAPPAESPKELVITEIMYNSPGTDLEYVEFYNNTSDTLDLTGMSIADAIIFTFPDVQLAPGAYILISDDSTTMASFWGVTAYNWTSGSLNNGGESITLRDTAGAVVDSVRYDDEAPWTTTPDGRGPSLILCSPDSNNNEGSNWQRAISSSGKIFDGREVFGNPGVGANCIDDAIVAIQNAETIVGEANGDITVLFYIDNPNDTVATTVNLDVLAGGSADATDYTFSSQTITFPPGTDTAQSVVIGIVDDGDQEAEESFTLILSNPSTGAQIANDTMRITIIDNDAPITSALKIIGLVHGPNSGVPKAVELYAVTDIPNLSLFGLGCANNGGGSDGQEYTFPAVSMEAGTCFYVANDTAGFRAFFGFSAEFQDDGSANNFNGDDAFEVFESGVVIDVFGEIDTDGTGTAWEYSLGWVHRKTGTGPDSNTFVIENWDFGGLNALVGGTTNDQAAVPYPVNTCETVGIDPVDLSQSIRIYPNPTAGQLEVETDIRLDRIEVRNLMGQQLMQLTQPSPNQSLDLAQLPAGVYLLSFYTEGKVWTKKVILEK